MGCSQRTRQLFTNSPPYRIPGSECHPQSRRTDQQDATPAVWIIKAREIPRLGVTRATSGARAVQALVLAHSVCAEDWDPAAVPVVPACGLCINMSDTL